MNKINRILRKYLFPLLITSCIAVMSFISGCAISTTVDNANNEQIEIKNGFEKSISDLGYFEISCRWKPDFYWYSLPEDYFNFGEVYCGNHRSDYSEDYWQWKLYSVNLYGQTYYLIQNKGNGSVLAGNNNYYPTNLGYDPAYPTTVPFMVISGGELGDNSWADNFLWIRETAVFDGVTYYRFKNKSYGAYLNIEHQMPADYNGQTHNYVMQSKNAPSDWQSSQWKLEPPPTFSNVSTVVVDKYATNGSYVNDLGGSRYIYQCQGSRANPSDPGSLVYVPANDGWWDVDGNGQCAKLSYINVPAGIAGFGTYLSPDGLPVNLSNCKGIRFWASSDYGIDNDPVNAPKAYVQINTANVSNYGWMGNYWNYEFPLTYNWQEFEVYFSNFKGPGISGPWSAPLKDSLTQVKAIEFQQSYLDNSQGKQNTGNIYIDDVELIF